MKRDTIYQVVPAAPGFFAIYVAEERPGTVCGYGWHPVVAWRVELTAVDPGHQDDRCSFVQALTPFGLDTDCIVRDPGGFVGSYETDLHPDEHAWFTDHFTPSVPGPCPHDVAASANDRIAQLVPSDVRCHACQGTGSVPAFPWSNYRDRCDCCRGAGEHLAVTP